jgi:RNA polymerase sigma-70 factor (ECF subfamily)
MSLPIAVRATRLCCQTELDLAQESEIDLTAPHFLLSRCGQGDHAAFEKLYNKGKIVGTAMMILKRRELAEEVVREPNLRISVNSSTYKLYLGSAIAWMVTIKRNLAIDVVRLSNFDVRADECFLTEIPTAHPSALEQIEFSQDRTYTLNELEKLDEMSRGLIIAAYLHGESGVSSLGAIWNPGQHLEDLDQAWSARSSHTSGERRRPSSNRF